MSARNVSGRRITTDAIKVALTLIIVKGIGIVKQAFIAAYYGAGAEMDAYLVANDFLGEIGVIIFASLSVSLLNFYLIKQERRREEAEEFVSQILSVFVPIAAVLAVIAVIFSKQLAFILAPGFDGQGRGLVVRSVLVLAITLVNSSISNTFTAVLEAEKDFVPGKLSGIIQSVCIIAGCVFLSEYFGINALLFSFVAYYFIQNIFLYVRSRRYIRLRLCRPRLTPEIRTIIAQSVPLFISNSAVQFNAMVDKAIASGIGSGIVSTLSYSHFILSSLHSIFAGGICSVIYSNFSSCAAGGDREKMYRLYRDGISIFILVLTPITIFTCANSFGVVKLLYMRGAFSEETARAVSIIVIAYVLGLIVSAVRDLSSYFCYANQDMSRPMMNTGVGVIVNIALSLALSKIWGGVGIAFATSIGTACGMVLMIRSAKIHLDKTLNVLDLRVVWQTALAGGISLIAMWEVNRIMMGFSVNYVLSMFINGVVLVIIYGVVLAVVGCEYARKILGMVKGK